MSFKTPQNSIINRVLKWTAVCSSLVLGYSAQSQEIPPGCRGSGLGISLFVNENTSRVGDTLVYSALVFNTPFPACQATEITASVTTPDGVVHPLVLNRTLLNPGEQDYYEDVVTYVIRAQDLRSDNALGAYVTAGAETKGRIQQNEEDSDGGGFQNVNTVVRNPCIAVTLDCTDGIGENGLLQYNGTVSNCGDNRLTDVFVVYNLGQQEITVLGPIELARNESVDFSFSISPSNPCLPVAPDVTARGLSTLSSRAPVSAFATASCQLQLLRSVVLETFCPPNAVAGQPYIYSGSVTNTGNVTLTGLVVTSDQPAPGTVVFTRNTLAPGATAQFTGEFVAPLSCEVISNLNVTGSGICGTGVADSSTLICPLETNPSIAVSNICSTDPIISGQTFQYKGIVTNTGNVTLTNIQVLADASAVQSVVFTQNSLAPGASAEFTVTANAPLDTCSITTLLTARGQDICTDEVVENQASATCPVQTSGSVNIVHDCPLTAPQPGSQFSFNATVTNTGNVTLSNLTVFGNLPTDVEVHTIASLAPGASENFIVTLTVPVNTCSVTTILRVVAVDDCGFNQVTDTSIQDCLVTTTPNIDVSLNCTDELVLPGHPVSFTGEVTNSGDIQLNDVMVMHSFNGTETPVFGPVSLAPGQTSSFSGSFVAPEGINACDITSSVIARAIEPCASSQISDQASATCSLLTRPAIRVIRDCPANPVAQGSILTYNGTVINEGNITLTNVVVYSGRPAANTQVFTIARLEPGQTADFTGSFVVPSNCCTVADTLRAEGTDICTGETVIDTTTASCAVLYTPLVEITKECPTEPVAIGETVNYNGVVLNTGDITLTNLIVFGNIQGSGAPYLGPINLAPGESVPYQASFVVSEENCGQETVIVEATSLCGDVQVTDSVTSACPIVVSPGVEVISFCPQGPLVRGMAAVYSGIVINTGDVSLSGVTVRSNISIHNGAVSEGSLVFGPDVVIGPGQSLPFSYEAFIPDDADCCELVSQLMVTGMSFCTSEEVTSTSTSVCQIQTNPAIDVQFTECPQDSLQIGAWVEYFGVVTNTGDIILDNVTVKATVNGEERVLVNSIMLAPGETELFTTMFEKTAAGNVQPLVAIAEGLDYCSGKIVLDASVCNPRAVEPFGVNSIQSNGSNELIIRANVLPGRLYMLQYSNSLTGNVWVNIDNKVVAESATVTFTDNYDSGVAARFYRVVEIR